MTMKAQKAETASTLPGPSLRRESGFSLIELMVAMVVTLIVSGAIYGLLSSGQSAFRREPELSDRQQNIRIAMALIERDVQRAGVSLPAFTQAFIPGGDGVGPNGQDALEIVAGFETCAPLAVCKSSIGGGVATLELPSGPPAGSICPTFPGLAAVAPGPTNPTNELFVIGQVTRVNVVTCDPATAPPLNTGLTGVAGGSPVGIQVTLPMTQGPAEWRPPGGAAPSATNPQLLFPVEVVRYEIAADPTDIADPNVPCLWRSVTGGRDAVDGFATLQAIPGPGWQMVARGIENLQIQYASGIPVAGVPPVVTDDAPLVAVNNFTTLVYQVQVSMSARVTAQNLQGETLNPALSATRFVRGELTTQIAPRAALLALTTGGQYR
jgi:prepilin-type N-terminal cleavage/methylation domain-containing protein